MNVIGRITNRSSESDSDTEQASLILFCQIHNNLAIVEKSGYLSEAGGGSRRTKSHPFQYHRPYACTDGFKHFFFPRTTATCNGLTEAVSSETVDGFKFKIQHPWFGRGLGRFCQSLRTSCK